MDTKRLMFVNMGLIPKETISWEWVDIKIYLEKALKGSNFAQNILTLKSQLGRLHTYFKFMVVRNPLERLVSGYINKIEPPLTADSKFKAFVSLRFYRSSVLKIWKIGI